MIPKIRKEFNVGFKATEYEQLLNSFNEEFGIYPAFKIAETPIFISPSLNKKLLEVCDSILDQLEKMDYNLKDLSSIPLKWRVPNMNKRPHFLCIDFGLCEDENGEISPQLIELQAFPSLYFYQDFLGDKFKHIYSNFPEGFRYLPKHLNFESYFEEVKQVILGDEKPEEVILMDIFPDKQKTKLDFLATEKATGIKTVCYTEIIKEGKDLFYMNNGIKTPIKRIYNRMIIDELERYPDIKPSFKLTDDLNVTWVTHPNWFMLISKQILPKLHHLYIPNSYFANEFPSTENIEEYVLKPLYSFAGKGVNLSPTNKDIQELSNPADYILQKKVNYAPLIIDPDGNGSKVEIRIFYIWKKGENRPTPVINLVRMSKGMMINVDHNKETLWTGASIAYFED